MSERLVEIRTIGARRFSDLDIEHLRQRHQRISLLVSETDAFLMFHSAGAFCCQLFNAILILYDLIFFRATDDFVVLMMRVFCMFGFLCGLSVTTAGGIMVNHYVSTKQFAVCIMRRCMPCNVQMYAVSVTENEY